jgi:hypothetical protein
MYMKSIQAEAHNDVPELEIGTCEIVPGLGNNGK